MRTNGNVIDIYGRLYMSVVTNDEANFGTFATGDAAHGSDPTT